MITYLKGTLAHKSEMPGNTAMLVVEVGGGVGFQVLTSLQSLLAAPAPEAPVVVHTSLVVREDAMQLVGFVTKEERDLFDILSSASGVGLKVALSLMSALTVSELAAAIMGGDFKRLTSAKGVGPKLAQKIAIELKEKMTRWREERVGHGAYIPAGGGAPVASKSFEEAETVLLSLGYSLSEIHQGLKALAEQDAEAPGRSSEEVLQCLLKWLATHPVH